MEYLKRIKTGKMSKSKGEFLTVSLLESKGYDPIIYRFMCLNSHYRKVLVFSYDAMDNAKSAYDKLKSKVNSLGSIKKETDKFIPEFKDALSDDLNTSRSLTVLYDVLKSDLNNSEKLYLVELFDQVLSLNLIDNKEIDDDLKKYIETKIDERNKAKQNKDYALADQIREELLLKNIVIKDTRVGTTYEIK